MGRLQLGGEGRVKGPGRGMEGQEGIREQVAGVGAVVGQGSGPPFQSEPRDALITVSIVQSQDQRARWLQLILGLGGGREGSFARVHLGGLRAWVVTHRVDPPAPLISCYSVGCIRLECECLLSWGEGVTCCSLWLASEAPSPAVSSWGRTRPGSSLGPVRREAVRWRTPTRS